MNAARKERAQSLASARPESQPCSKTREAREPAATTSGHVSARPKLTEEQLAALWRGQRFPEGALVTRAGVAVRVIAAGRAGRGPGPDFRGAVIAGPSGVPLRGDVELHVRSSSFRAHGHEDDPAYARVVLHVVFEDDTGADTPLPGGGSAAVVALAPWVARRSEELQHWLARPLLWREPCHDAVMRLGEEGVAAALASEGDRRFDARAAVVAQAVRASGLSQALYEYLLEALGYGGNAPAMLALGRLLPWRRLRERAAAAADPAFEMEALLLGSGGLLPSQRGHRGPVERHVRRLESAFRRHALPSLDPGVWKLWGVRPANAPARRVAAAAALLRSLAEPEALLACLDANTAREATAPLTAARASGYWSNHHDTCAGPSRLPAAYVGRSRAIEILSNVVLPAACASGDGVIGARARALFAKLPRPAVYGVTRYLEGAVASEGHRIPVNARRAHGLLALNRDWCTQGGCGRCPLS